MQQPEISIHPLIGRLLFDAQDAGTAVNRRHSSASGRFPLLPANQFQNPFAADLQEDFDFNYR